MNKDATTATVNEIDATSEIVESSNLEDLGEIDKTPEITEEQMKKFVKFVNKKINHFSHKERVFTKRRKKNKMAKKSRKKNR